MHDTSVDDGWRTARCTSLCGPERVVLARSIAGLARYGDRMHHDHAPFEATLVEQNRALTLLLVLLGRGYDVSRRAQVVTGCLAIDLRSQGVTVDGAVVSLSPREWRLIEALAYSLGRVVELDVLVDRVWPERIGARPLLRAHAAARLRSLMTLLKAKLGPARDLIVARMDAGYVLVER